MKIKFLKECTAPAERLLHPGEGCSCSTMDPTWFAEGEELEDYELHGQVDISGLKYNVDYIITEYP